MAIHIVMHNRIRMDLLYLLRWNLLADLNEITIVVPDQAIPSPFFSHASADESFAIPPLSRVEVTISDCVTKRDFDKRPDPFRSQPPPLLIIHEDDQPITLKQFVTKVHAYLNHHMDEIKRVKGDCYRESIEQGRLYLPDSVGFFFKSVYANAPVDNKDLIRVAVAVFADSEFGLSVDRLWASNLRYTDWHENDRQE
ncbi:uncharacterized protein BDR25DRAFT_44344 [Lindgomyces ingoldianus]|uniref:Uncharacterized protein n=1 Tax=Lindgomyces ingoldianus TaxID=673940 RepID=A0ACB6RD88_9PLEO|nr:uncharacterized protein BDR25DRAFT_44344 [Lindgomyces ingoldianus]KAF2477209.1 hypothetical protein BDR25DRAFT_44344 [Lindgomyces ingoldianus]